jgi:hypothetical protein
MKKTMRITGIFIGLTWLLAACTTTPEPMPESSQQIIELPGYSVACPQGKKWNRKIDETNQKIIFFKTHQNLLFPELYKVTSIEIHENIAFEELWDMTAEEVAEDFLNKEEETMRLESEEGKNYKLKKTEKGSMEIGDKKLYKMYWKSSSGGGWTPLKTTEGTIFLYFPTDFNTRHHFYMFLIVDGYIGIVYKHDPEPVYSVIESFAEKAGEE